MSDFLHLKLVTLSECVPGSHPSDNEEAGTKCGVVFTLLMSSSMFSEKFSLHRRNSRRIFASFKYQSLPTSHVTLVPA